MKIQKKYQAYVEKALLIRKTENKLLDLFIDGVVNGTVHTCVGQEFIGVAIAEALTKDDAVYSNHRGHGHFIALTNDVEGLISEVMGKNNGVSKGIGGSQHLHANNFFSNGIQGGMMPIAAGKAFANKINKKSSIVVIFVGDGTLGEGIFYETLNIASKWELPILIVLENNMYAQSTKITETISGTIEGRAHAFNIKYRLSDTWDWKQLIKESIYSVDWVRNNSKPLIFEVKTYRLNAHSKGDDNRDKKEIDTFVQKDPLNIILSKDSEFIRKTEQAINKRLNKSVANAEADKNCQYNWKPLDQFINTSWKQIEFKSDRISNLIHLALNDQLELNNNTVIIGEDIEGPYGGAFKVTKDLSIKYPDKVKNTPISESTIVGMGTGLAMSGFYTVVEIMFGDFLTLCFDQILNHATKFYEIYGRKINIPLLIRVPMGGKRGYGPTHSQSIEKHFLGIPNLDVLAINQRICPKYLINNIFKNIKKPTLLIENKILYTRDLKTEAIIGFELEISNEKYPTIRMSPSGSNPNITLFCYGGILEEIELAAEKVFYENEILCEIICPTQINPLNFTPIFESIEKTGHLLIVEDGPSVASLGSEICAKIVQNYLKPLKVQIMGYDGIIPCSLEVEKKITPHSELISKKIVNLIDD